MRCLANVVSNLRNDIYRDSYNPAHIMICVIHDSLQWVSTTLVERENFQYGGSNDPHVLIFRAFHNPLPLSELLQVNRIQQC